MDLKIDEDFKNLLPDLTAEEYTGLEKDIVKHGILSPIIVWDSTIIDGHNRFAIAQAHHLMNIPTKAITFKSKSDAMQWIISHQLSKRNLTKSQLVSAYAKYEEELAREAEKKLHLSKGQGVKGSSNLNEVKKEAIRTAAEVAKKIGVSENTYRDMKTIVSKGTQEQVERMDKGGKGNSVSKIANEIKGKNTETKKCAVCKKVLPITEFSKKGNGYRSYCMLCDANTRRERRKSEIHDVKGNLIASTGEFSDVPDEEIVADLYDTEREIQFTVSDIKEEFLTNFKTSMMNLRRILDSHKDIVENNKKEISKMWNDAEASFQAMKGDYV